MDVPAVHLAFIAAVLFALLLGLVVGRQCGIGECLWRFRTRTAPRRKWLRRNRESS